MVIRCINSIMSLATPDSIPGLIERHGHLLFLVGAGVSAKTPSSYPLWDDAVQLILKDAVSQGFPNELKSAFQYYIKDARHYDAVDLVERFMTPVAFERLLERVFGNRERPPITFTGCSPRCRMQLSGQRTSTSVWTRRCTSIPGKCHGSHHTTTKIA